MTKEPLKYHNKKCVLLLQHPEGQPHHHREHIIPELLASGASVMTETLCTLTLAGSTSPATLITVYDPSQLFLERFTTMVIPLVRSVQSDFGEPESPLYYKGYVESF